MAEQARQEENESRQADAPDQAERTEMAAQDEIQGPVAQPLLPPIQAAQSGHDQSQGPMQASSPQQQQQAYGNGNGMQQQQPQQQQPDQQQQQPHQHQQQQQQQLPVQSPTTSQSPYESRPQQSHYAQPPPVQQQHQHQQQPPPPPPPPPQQQQQQHQQQAPVAVQYEHAAPPQSNGAPPGYAPAQQIPPPHHNPYQYQQPAQYPQPGLNGDANGFPTQMRYSMPLPPNGMNAQQLSGTRHKKEIKRRTKTGCLTCRKRRIKCDEGHPTCRNCQKSKRECLGYDPIFKPQTGQPANIQPQPGSLGSLPPPPDSQSPQAPPPLAPHAHYSNIPQGYVPASSAGYAPAPAMQNQLDQGYDYGSAIDPALAAVHPAASHIPPPPMPPPQEEYSTILLPERNVRLITMDDAYHLDGIPPSFPPPRDPSQPIPQHQVDAVRDLYLREYAPGLDRFFETDWYGTQGLNLLMVDRHLLHYFAHCIERFQQPPSEQNKGLPSIEARLIWVLATMAMDPNQGPLAHVPRIEAVSHIILGTFMPSERVPPAPAPSSMPDPKTAPDAYAFYLQDLFWHHLSSFVTIRDDNSRSQSSGQEIANQLAGMRNILSMLENRDVLYSMAIARHFGGRMERYEPDKVLVGRGTEAEDPINKLVVAMGFLGNEEVQGTTQVVQRLCGMSRRAFLLQRLDSVSPNGHIQANGVHPMPPATT